MRAGRLGDRLGSHRVSTHIDAALDFFKVAGAEVGVEASVAKDFVVDLLLREAAAETKFNKGAGGQASRAVGTEGTFVDGVAVDLAALGVRRDSDAAAHVDDDKMERLVGTGLFAGKAAGDRAGVEDMADGRALDERRAGKAGAGLPLVGGDGVDDVGVDAGGLGKAEREESSEVGGVLAAAGEAELFNHGFVDEVSAAGDGGQESSAAGDSGDLGGLIGRVGEGVGDDFGSIVEAGDHGSVAEAGQFLVAVADGANPLGAVAGVEAELGGGGTGVDGQDLGAGVGAVRGAEFGLGQDGVRQATPLGRTASIYSEPECTPGLEANAGAAVTVIGKWSRTGRDGAISG